MLTLHARALLGDRPCLVHIPYMWRKIIIKVTAAQIAPPDYRERKREIEREGGGEGGGEIKHT